MQPLRLSEQAIGRSSSNTSEQMDERCSRIASRFEWPLLVAAVLTVPVTLLEAGHPGEPWDTVVIALNWAIWTAFACEMAVMLAVVPSKSRWLREHPVEVVIVLFTAPFLLSAFQGLRLLRALRLLRVMRLTHARILFSLEGLRYVTLLALLTLIGGGEAFATVEKVRFGDGIYWALTTMTTVGYGDVVPHTDTGKFIAGAIMILGIGFFAVLTGAVAHRFLAGDIAEVEQAVEHTEATEADLLDQVREIGARLRALELALARRRSPG